MPLVQFNSETRVIAFFPVRLRDTNKVVWLKPVWRVSTSHFTPLFIFLGIIWEHNSKPMYADYSPGEIIRGAHTDRLQMT